MYDTPSTSKRWDTNMIDYAKMVRNLFVWSIPAIITSLTKLQTGETMGLRDFLIGLGFSLCIEFLLRFQSSNLSSDTKKDGEIVG